MSRGTLFVVATPIGNLEDITLRALRVLAEARQIAAEDTRVTARLLKRHQIDTPCTSFREQNAARALPGLLAKLEAGQDVALVSDAGTPGVSDPGEQLVAAAAAAGIQVCPIPGPSAMAAAISVAGLPGAGARFHGFLPRSGKHRRAALAVVATDPACHVIYESPSRLAATLRDLAQGCEEQRQAAVLRELTKIHEEIARDTLIELADRFAEKTRGEITIVVAGAPGLEDGISAERLAELVQSELARGISARDVAATLSRTLGVPRKQVYDLALTAKRRDQD